MSVTSPPAIVIQDGHLYRQGEMTRAEATAHVADMTQALKAHEALIADLPEGPIKTKLRRSITVLHNRMGRGGETLNRHYALLDGPPVSPDSAGGDKNDETQPQQA